MPKVRIIKGPDGTEYVSFQCPGCKDAHTLPFARGTIPGPTWTFDRNLDAPTLVPSILAKGKDWDYDEKDEPCNVRDVVCHSHVRAGNIEFLTDSTHPLAGKTVPLTELEQDPKNTKED